MRSSNMRPYLLLISLAFAGCNSNSIPNIERVLKQDQAATEHATSVADIVARMRAIDLAGCPSDFKSAYVDHIHGWELMASVEIEAKQFDADFNSSSAMLEAFIRGVMLDPFGKAEEGLAAQRQLRSNYEKATTAVRDTFHRVEEIAVAHGATLPKQESGAAMEWRGSCAQPNMEPYPMIMQMTIGQDNKISGTVNWPTLNNSTTRFTGTIDGTTVRFVETQLLSGSGIGIPCVYEGDLLGNTIAGTCVYADQQASFSVTAVKQQ